MNGNFLSYALLEGVKLLRRKPWLILVCAVGLFVVGNFGAILALVFGWVPVSTTSQKVFKWLGAPVGRLALVLAAWFAGWWLAGWGLALWWLLDMLWPDRGGVTKEKTT